MIGFGDAKKSVVKARGRDTLPRRPWIKEELERLALLYPSRSTAVIAATLGRTLASVYAMADKLGLKKHDAYLRSEVGFKKGSTIGAAFRFKKGLVPHNKGLRRPGWYRGRMRETQFKKGARTGKAALNWKPIGTILPDSEGYLRIKVREAEHGKEATGFGNTKVWPLLNRHVWERAHGPIPPGHAVAFKDGDRANCKIDNLELISRAELARRNRMWTVLPRELAEAIHLNGQLKRRLRNAQEGSTNGKEQDQRPARPPLRNHRSAEGSGQTHVSGAR